MPILDIEFVGEENLSSITQQLANAAGQVLNSPPGLTWVRVRSLPSSQYAENSDTSNAPLPVFVSVLLRKLPEQTQMERIAKGLCAVVADVSGRPKENVHILFLPEGAGRVAFGGNF